MIIIKNQNIVFRRIHDSSFLINISDNYYNDKCALYEINDTGMFIWNSIDGIRSIAEIAVLLKQEIIDDIDYQIIYNDVVDFVGCLLNKHFVEVRQYE